MNQLTERLLAEGYTKDNHPEYVRWSDWKDFEYTREYLKNSVWETPCGLLQNGTGSYNHMSHMGIDYCPENDNPRYGCPYYDETECPNRIDTRFVGCNCIYHQTDREYDYEQSVEKIWDAWDRERNKAWNIVTAGYGYCACMEWDRPNRRYKPKYDVSKCVSIGCSNEICAITKKQRNLEKVNIFYDILRVWKFQIGFAETVQKKIEKGVKQFDKPVARTDAEIWLKAHKKDFKPRRSRQDRTDLFFSEQHGKTGFGEYTKFEFTTTPQNIRIERRESRDLLQDLRDAAEGLEVIHANDIVKAEKQAKTERRKKSKEDKKTRLEKKNIAKWKLHLTDDNAAKAYAEANEVGFDYVKESAEKQLKKRGIEKPPEQITLF